MAIPVPSVNRDGLPPGAHPPSQVVASKDPEGLSGAPKQPQPLPPLFNRRALLAWSGGTKKEISWWSSLGWEGRN